MKLKITLLFYFTFTLFVNAQVSVALSPTKPVEVVDADKLVSVEAFKKLLFQDLNFAILGENTPAQGFSTELTDNSSKLSVKGFVKRGTNWLVTIDGNFAVDKGVYFFDEDGGSKQANFAVNYFYVFGYNRNFISAKDLAVQRALINRNFLEKDTIYKVYENFYKLHDLMVAVNLPTDTLYGNDYVVKAHENNKQIILNKSMYTPRTTNSELGKLITEFELENKHNNSIHKDNFNIINIRTVDQQQNKTTTNQNIKLNFVIDGKIINPKKLLEVYKKALADVKAIHATVEDLELKNGADKWTRKQFFYLGFSPYYQRENLTVFNYIEGASFNDFFSDQRGDLYGVNASLNWFSQSSKYLFYLRALTSVGRGSNINSFSKRTYVYNDIIGNGTTIANEKVGYINGRGESYGYGTATSGSFEAYGMRNGYGLFVKLGYNTVDFKDNSRFKRVERYPFRAGVLFNLKSTSKKKNLLTLQLFIDRSNLKLSPTPSDPTKADDWRFGFKIGLPINIQSKL
ncbi:hypothetical protein [Kordia sp.]|uniref:hypothetical protein n=1 Tax=Kordia sp. TaxID=1965332 RepID=UPI003D6AD4CD